MQLHVESRERETAVLLIRWCLSRGDIEIARKFKPGSVFVLLSVVSQEDDCGGYCEEGRHLVPVEKMAIFVTFLRPGPHKIYGALIHIPYENDAQKILKVEGRNRGLPRYSWDVIERREIFPKKVAVAEEVKVAKTSRKKSVAGGKKKCPTPKGEPLPVIEPISVGNVLPRQWENAISEGLHFFKILPLEDGPKIVARAEVNVDERFFAKKPRDWRYVNYMFEAEPLDQCSFRRRRIFAYSVQVVLLALIYLFVLIAGGFWLLLGYRRVNLRVLNPRKLLDTEIDDLWTGIKRHDSIFFCDKKGRTRFWRIPFFPPLLLVEAAFFFCARFALREKLGSSLDVAYAWGGFLLLWTIIFLVLPAIGLGLLRLSIKVVSGLGGTFINRSFKGLGEKLSNWQNDCKAEKEKNARAKERVKWEHLHVSRVVKEELARQQFAADLGALRCDVVPNVVDGVNGLPEVRRTAYLRFLDFKRRVCSPYPKG